MWVFWIVTGLLAATCAALVMARAGAAARLAAQGSADPAQPVYRRQLAELDEAAAQGLLRPDEHRAARAEAARRLLRAADARLTPERTGGRASRLAAALGAVAAAALALAVYLALGHPGLGDEPYAARLASWRRADPATLDPARMAAVLGEIAKARPHDAQVYQYLGRAQMAAGHPFDAGRAFAQAAALAPDHADLFAAEGEALVQDAGGKVTPQAVAVFRQAQSLDPKNAAARYYLGLAEVTGGRTAAGIAAWRALAADLSPEDPRRGPLLDAIAEAQTGGSLGAAVPRMAGAAQGADAIASASAPSAMFIQAMVARQAAELRGHPDDPAGWARLVRSYRVLGDAPAEQAALTQARRLFVTRPGALAAIEAATR